MGVIRANGGEQVRYTDGRLYSTHVPADGIGAFKLGPDRFEQRFSLEVPVDGQGMPAIHVMLLRLICQNGAVGMQRALRSDVRLGERPDHSLDRALSSFGNADGFSAMRQRFESAQRSWASLEEVRSLEAILSHGGWGGGDAAPARRAAWGRMTGDLHGIYGITAIEGISPKRRRLLPARCRMYDLLNFASEVSTHHAPPGLARRIDGWIGTAIVDEFDLEGSAKDVSDFEALFTPCKQELKCLIERLRTRNLQTQARRSWRCCSACPNWHRSWQQPGHGCNVSPAQLRLLRWLRHRLDRHFSRLTLMVLHSAPAP